MKLLAPTVALAVLFAAGAAHAQTSEEMVVRYPPPLVRLKLAAVGVALTGAAWGASFAAAQAWPEVTQPTDGTVVSSGPPGSNQLKIPIVGPWIALAGSGCSSDNPGCSSGVIVARGFLYVLDGIVQLAGLGLIAEAIVMKTEAAPRKLSASLFGLRYRGVEVRPAPMTASGTTGFGLVGTF